MYPGTMPDIPVLELCLLGMPFALLYAFSLLRVRRRPYPPGPKGYPLVGNMFDDFPEHRWLAYRDLCVKYHSDIIHLNMAGTHVMVLNSRAAATELFERRSTIYSDRPQFTMLNELSGLGWQFAFQRYGNVWRERRALFHTVFQPPALLEYYPGILASSRNLLVMISRRPSDFMLHIRHMTARNILGAAYGIEVQPERDPYVDLAERSLKAISLAARPGVYAVDCLPWLKIIPRWFAGAGFLLDAEEYRKDIMAMREVPFRYTKKSMAEGTVRPSIASKDLQDLQDEGTWTPEREDVLKDVVGTMYVAGADTTVSALGSFILAMMLHPDVQKKAQSIIDAAIGSSRLPEHSDRESLPYIEAIMHETLRWKPVTPLGVAHASMSDDVYNGYYIPKGSIVVGNTWAILRDEAIYGEDAACFRPERFMKGDEMDPNVPLPEAGFGFGRRICAGKESAETTLWITMACLLAVFNFKAKDGITHNYIGDYTFGLVSYPPDFECEITPRGEKATSLIEEIASEP